MDGSIGRIVEIKQRQIPVALRALRPEAQVVMVFKDAATALQALLPNRKQSDIIHNAKNFKMVTTGPDDLVVWLAHTLNMSETAGLPMGTPMARRQPSLHHLHQRRSLIRLRQGRPHPAGHPDRVRRQPTRPLGRSKPAAANSARRAAGSWRRMR